MTLKYFVEGYRLASKGGAIQPRYEAEIRSYEKIGATYEEMATIYTKDVVLVFCIGVS